MTGRLDLWVRNGQAGFAGPQPLPPDRFLPGCPVVEVLEIMPRLFNLCAMAQTAALQPAFAVPDAGADLTAGVLRDHLALRTQRRPRALGMAPLRANRPKTRPPRAGGGGRSGRWRGGWPVRWPFVEGRFPGPQALGPGRAGAPAAGGLCALAARAEAGTLVAFARGTPTGHLTTEGGGLSSALASLAPPGAGTGAASGRDPRPLPAPCAARGP